MSAQNSFTYSKSFPSGNLSMIVEQYVYRSIEIRNQSQIKKYMPCRRSNSIDFFLGDEYETLELNTGEFQPFNRCTIRGPRTFKKYSIYLKGNFRSFTCRFKPTGLFQLLGVPMEEFCDIAWDATLIKKSLFTEITDRLMACKDLESCIAVAEPYISKLASSSGFYVTPVTKLASLILNSDNPSTIQSLYEKLPLTPRQLERNFKKEIGVTPKMFSGLVRFEKMINQKINQPQKKWTELAYDNNYFDQMHMIKDFHRFLDINPKQFEIENFAF